MSLRALADCTDSAITPGYSRNVHSKLLKQYPFKSADCFFARVIGLPIFRYITKKDEINSSFGATDGTCSAEVLGQIIA